MPGGEVRRREPAQAAGDQCQGVADGQHQRRARARGEPEQTGLADGAGRDHDTGRATERAPRTAGDRHEVDAAGAHVRQQPDDLLRLPRLRQREHEVIAAQHAEIAMHGLGRMEEVARRAGGGERGRNLAGHDPRLADAGDDDAAGAGFDEPHRPDEAGVESGGRLEHGLGLGPENLPAVRQHVGVGHVADLVHGQAGPWPRGRAGAGL